jgi:hypothetical protein
VHLQPVSELEPNEARQATTNRMARYALLGLPLALIGMFIVWYFIA